MPSPPRPSRTVSLLAKRLAVAGWDALPAPLELLAAHRNSARADVGPLSVGVVHVGWTPSRSATSLAALRRSLSPWRRTHAIAWCDVRNDAADEGFSPGTPSTVTVTRDNEDREFGGLQAGVDALTTAGSRPDVWVLANDRWAVDLHPAFRRPHPALAQVAAATGGMIGRVDRFPGLVRFRDGTLSGWARSNLLVVSDRALAGVAVVGCTESAFDRAYPEVWPGLDWVPDGLDPAYWALLVEWLTGGPGPLARGWYQRQPLTAATWPPLRRKVLSILNEHLLSVACLDAGHPIIDVASADRLARLGYQTPVVRACLQGVRDASPSRRPVLLTPAQRSWLAIRSLAGPGRDAAMAHRSRSARDGRAGDNDCERPVLTILSPFMPDSRASHAGGQYLASYCVEASRYADVTVVTSTPTPIPTPSRSATDYAVEFVNVHAAGIFDVALITRTRNALAGLTPGPGVVHAFRSNPTVRRLVRDADIVEVHFTQFLPVAAALLPRPAATVVSVFAYDVHFQSLTRQARTTESVVWRTGARIATAVARYREPRLLNRSDVVSVFSAKDADLLRELAVCVPVNILSPNIAVPSAWATHDGPPVVLFVGAMFRRVNYQAVDEFLKAGWPTVRAAVPDARFVVVGAEPPPHLVSDPEAGVAVSGFVPDLDSAYRDASCLVAPLTAGAGVKFKVVQAMACGLPVVGTPVAFEGLPGAPGIVVNSSLEAADQLIGLLHDRERRRELGAAGRSYVHSNFDFAGSVRDLHGRYRRLLSARRGVGGGSSP